MRILQVIHGFLPQFRGGTELYLLGLSRHLRRLGHDVHILTGTTDSAEESHVEEYSFDSFPVRKVVLSGSYLEHWTRSFSPEASRLFAESLAAVQPDVVHVQHWFRLSRTLLETCHRMGIPAVCTLHDLWTTCPRIFRIREENWCDRPLSGANCADCVPKFPWMQEEDTSEAVDLFRSDFVNELACAHRIIVPSRAHGEVIGEVTDLPKERLQVVPHGTIIDLQKDRPEAPPARRSFGSRGRGMRRKPVIRLGVWGHLFHMKGAHLVLDALQSLRDKSRFELHVWGRVTEPRYKARLEKAAEGLDVQWHGAFVPEDLRKVELDLAVIPSLCSESFSFVLDEAFDLNLPAIVPRRGALEERVGAAGTTFIAEDANDLARVFKTLLKKPDLIDRWRSAIPELTTMTSHTREIAYIYKDVLKNAERIELHTDAGLAWRRLEFQTRQARRQEAMMFGYLGHIKRETGRGDHFEGEMRQLMAEKEEWAAERNRLEGELAEVSSAAGEETLAVLGAEIEALRDALAAFHDAAHPVRRKAPEIGGDETHVPGLGTPAELIAVNQQLLDEFVAGLKVRAQQVKEVEKARAEDAARAATAHKEHADELLAALDGRDSTIRFLAGEIASLRRLLNGDEAQEEAVSELPADDIPGLGDGAAVRAGNEAAAQAHAESVHRDRQSLRLREEVVAFLAAEIALLRGTIAGVFDRDQFESRSDAAPAMSFDVPGLGEPQDIAAVDDDLMKALLTGFEALQGELDAHRELTDRLQGELGGASGALEDLSGLYERRGLMIEKLGVLVDELRRGITVVFSGDGFEPTAVDGIDEIEEHVPGLGDLRTVRAINLELLATLHEAIGLNRPGGDAPPEEGDPS